MQPSTKGILKKIFTILLVPIVGVGIFIFSLLGSFGAWISIGEQAISPAGHLDDDIVLPILGITIGLIIIIPVIRLISKAAGQRWRTAFYSLFLLGWYLVAGGIIITVTMFVASFFRFFENGRELSLVSLCRFVSAALAIGYYFYFKKIIKPRAAKV